MHVDYVGLGGTNLARSHRFFTKGLGLFEGRRGKMFHGGIRVLFQDPVCLQRIELN